MSSFLKITSMSNGMLAVPISAGHLKIQQLAAVKQNLSERIYDAHSEIG
ncbi:MAG: hypothetical protein ACRD4J_01120 [Nitrososphaeraceae archaeon]